MIRQAFVLGAGLGTRLLPLTRLLPKPLIPVFHQPLITFAFRHLHAAGIGEFIVNTHHLPQRYAEAFPDGTHAGCPIHFRHEPVLLETGGGIKNIENLAGDRTLLVYNGDILTDLPLAAAMAAHQASGRLATLVLRSSGGPLKVALDPASGDVIDIAGRLGTETGFPRFLYTGICLLEPEIFSRIPDGEIISIVPIWTELIRTQPGSVGGVVLDEGGWWDLGSPGQYLEVHRFLSSPGTHMAIPTPPAWPTAIHPSAQVAGVTLSGMTAVGPGARIAPGSSLHDVIVWPETILDRPAAFSEGILTSCGFVAAA